MALVTSVPARQCGSPIARDRRSHARVQGRWRPRARGTREGARPMDLTDIHRALERLDAVLGAAQAALDEAPALREARHAYLEAYAEARSAQGPPARDATTAGRLAAAQDALTHLEQTQAQRREDVRTQVHRAAELLEAAQATLLKAERQGAGAGGGAGGGRGLAPARPEDG